MSLIDWPRKEIVDSYRILQEVNAVQALEIKRLLERLEQCEAALHKISVWEPNYPANENIQRLREYARAAVEGK